MVKAKRAKSKPPNFRKCQCVERTKKGYCNSVQQCPHIHFKGDVVDRDGLGHNEYLNLLCTPKGYRWPPLTTPAAAGEDGEEEEENAGLGERGIGKRLICHGQKERKADRQYVHNFLAEVWALLTPEMVNRLKEMLQNEFKMTPEEARTFIDKQMEYNINNSSSVGMFKKERKLNDGKVVWDSVVKLRKKNSAQCSMSPKNHLGMRNNWIKEFSNLLSDKASAYILETMSAERTSRQEEIAQTLLNRFNDALEQEASMNEPKTVTHKAMVMVADKMSLWLDKNVKVSKNVGVHLRQMEEEEKKKRLIEEMQRLEQERRDREEEKKRKMAEDLARKAAESKSAHDVMQPPPETEGESKDPKADEDNAAMEPEMGDDKPQEKDDKPPGDGQEDGQQAQEQEPQPPSPTTDSTDTAQKTEEPVEDEKELGGTQQILEDSQEAKTGETGTNEGETQESDVKEEKLDDTDERKTENEVLDDMEKDDGKVIEEETVEPDVSPDSPISRVLGVEGAEDTIDSNYPAPDIAEASFETLGNSYTPSELAGASPQSFPPSSDSEFSDDMNVEPSKDSATLVEELLDSAVDDEDTGLVDNQDDHGGKSVDDRTNMVLNELAEMIAATREEHSPLQEAIKDIMGKELEERLGDKNVETINEVAGKVGTWMDKMVERAGEEYGERRSPSRARSASPRVVSRPKVSSGMSRMPELVPQVGHSPEAVPQTSYRPAAQPDGPTPTAVSPEGLAESSFETARSPSPQPPVSQKAKGPIFQLRKVDTKNIFNVAGISNTKAKRKIREARGLSTSSRRFSQESLDLEEWAEWAGLVSDVGRNWAKWVEDVAGGAETRDYNNDKWLFHDAKEWQNINKELKREGDVWMKKVMRKQSKKKNDRTPPESNPLTA